MGEKPRGRPKKRPEDKRLQQPKISLTPGEKALWLEAQRHDNQENLAQWVRWVVGLHLDYEAARGWRPEGELAAQELARRKKSS